MAYVPLEKLLEKTGGSIFKLVVLIARRALDLAEGKPKLVEADPALKPATVAMLEIAAGKIRYKVNS